MNAGESFQRGGYDSRNNDQNFPTDLQNQNYDFAGERNPTTNASAATTALRQQNFEFGGGRNSRRNSAEAAAIRNQLEFNTGRNERVNSESSAQRTLLMNTLDSQRLQQAVSGQHNVAQNALAQIYNLSQPTSNSFGQGQRSGQANQIQLLQQIQNNRGLYGTGNSLQDFTNSMYSNMQNDQGNSWFGR